MSPNLRSVAREQQHLLHASLIVLAYLDLANEGIRLNGLPRAPCHGVVDWRSGLLPCSLNSCADLSGVSAEHACTKLSIPRICVCWRGSLGVRVRVGQINHRHRIGCDERDGRLSQFRPQRDGGRAKRRVVPTRTLNSQQHEIVSRRDNRVRNRCPSGVRRTLRVNQCRRNEYRYRQPMQDQCTAESH